MRLRPEWLVALVVALAPAAGVAQDAPPPAGEAPTRTEIEKALDKVENDPNLSGERTVNMLRWKEAEPVTDEPWWWRWANGLARWVSGFFGWIAESGRLIVWVLGAFLATLLVLYVVRTLRIRGLPRVPGPLIAPSHVRDLDIRPESLPDDIGAAALALWERGEQRGALALLYRGLLSRLVHVYAVPIRSSSTEGECVALVRQRLAEPNARYAARLVDTWAAAVYGGQVPAAGTMQALCGDFAATLDHGVGAT